MGDVIKVNFVKEPVNTILFAEDNVDIRQAKVHLLDTDLIYNFRGLVKVKDDVIMRFDEIIKADTEDQAFDKLNIMLRSRIWEIYGYCE